MSLAKIKLVEWDGSKPLVDGQKIVIKAGKRIRYPGGSGFENFGPLFLGLESWQLNTAIPKEDYVFAKDATPTAANVFSVKILPKGERQFVGGNNPSEFQNVALQASNGKYVSVDSGGAMVAKIANLNDAPFLILDLQRKSVFYWCGYTYKMREDLQRAQNFEIFGFSIKQFPSTVGEKNLFESDQGYSDASYVSISLVQSGG